MKAQLIDLVLTGNNHVVFKYLDQPVLSNPFHFHHAYEIVFIERGTGKRVVGDNVSCFSDGDLVLMGPNLPHVWQNDSALTSKNGIKAYVIYFAVSFAEFLAYDDRSKYAIDNLLFRANRGIYFKVATQKLVSDKIAATQHQSGLKRLSTFIDIVDILSASNEFDYLASEGYKNNYSQKDAGRFNGVYQYLIQNFHKTISLEDMASVAHLSPAAFCRFFKKRTNKSFTRFLNELRIGHACRLLQKNEYSISEICYQSGFNNMVHFNKCFKALVQCTPTQYKAKIACI